jgi:hypothetical protein
MIKTLTHEYIKEALTYIPDSGVFIWNKRPQCNFKNPNYSNAWNGKYENTFAGSVKKGGYVVLHVGSKSYFAHRLAFLYMEGFCTENDIDHIDGDRANNRWINLREASSRCNGQNRKIAKNNTSGVVGVTWHKLSKKWMASLMISGKTIYV